MGGRRGLFLDYLGLDVLPAAPRPAEDEATARPIPGAEEEAAPRAAGRGDALAALREEMGDCRRCALADGRRSIVFGTGNPEARLLFVGEGPGEEEDRQGEPFVGAAGRLLNDMIRAMGLRREEVYICNVVKCRPPGNREPLPGEVAACRPFLDRQIEIVAPEVICALGTHAARAFLGADVRITRVRGSFRDHRGTPLMPTFHPAYLLRNPQSKREAWADLQRIMERLGLPRAGRS